MFTFAIPFVSNIYRVIQLYVFALVFFLFIRLFAHIWGLVAEKKEKERLAACEKARRTEFV